MPTTSTAATSSVTSMPVRPVAVITGASSGIGKAAAIQLIGLGWRVIALGRNPQSCASAEAELRAAAADSSQVTMLRADLALMSAATAAAATIATLTDRVDALLNNAGGMSSERHITAEGNEGVFAGNHLGHFVLTQQLLPLLRKAATAINTATEGKRGARIINVASLAHEYCPGFNWDDLQLINHFDSGAAYCQAKLANVLFTRELARRLASDTETAITVHAMHPGVVASNFYSHADEAMLNHLKTRDTITPEQAGSDLVWLATAAEPAEASGDYYYLRETTTIGAAAQDDSAAQRLWQESEKLTGLSFL